MACPNNRIYMYIMFDIPVLVCVSLGKFSMVQQHAAAVTKDVVYIYGLVQFVKNSTHTPLFLKVMVKYMPKYYSD